MTSRGAEQGVYSGVSSERATALHEAISRIALALTAAKTPDDVASVVLSGGPAALGVQRIALWRIEDGWLVLQRPRSCFPDKDDIVGRVELQSSASIAGVVRTGEPQWLWARTGFGSESTPQSSAFLPLTVQGRTSGVLALRFDPELEVGHVERRLFTLLASQCGLALERVELFAGEENARLRIGRLQEVTAAFSRASTTEEVSEVACRIGAEAIGAVDGVLWIAREDGALELASAWGVPAWFIEQFRVIGAAAAERSEASGPVWVESEDDYRRVAPEAFAASQAAGRTPSWCAIPLMVHGRLAGLMSFAHAKGHRYDAQERAFCTTLAGHCAQALDRARLLDAARRSNGRLRLLAAATEAFSASMEYESTLRRIMVATIPFLADYCFFDIVEAGEIRRIAEAHEDPQIASDLQGTSWVGGGPRDLGAASPARFLSQFHPIVDDAWMRAAASTEEHLEAMRRHRLCSLVTVSLSAHEERIGALTLCYGKSGRHYACDDLAVAEELARRAAVAIEQSRLYRTAQAAARRAEDANRVKDEFLATVSHELRTPLNAISGWSSLLVQKIGDPPAVAKAVEVIRRNVRAQTQIVEDILDVSRIITGKLKIDPRPVDMISIVRDALDVVRPSADAKRIAMRFERVAPEPCLLVGDAQRLQQVVWNLLSNAIKFTDPGGSVQIEVVQEGAEVALTVADTGRGIEAEFLPYVFERFKQADSSTTRKFGGLGLGLAIVRHIVELHGGHSIAESPGVGRGATFRVALPVRAVVPRSLHDDPPSVRRSVGLPAGPCSIVAMRILVVDDEPDARELIQEVLVNEGGTVETASSVREALGALDRFRPDVIVTDIGMPDEDGYAFVRSLRKRPVQEGGAIPVVALTAYARDEDRARVLGAGFSCHVPKPVDPQELIAVIATMTPRMTDR
jgi:signal transduction histidine kinase/ActR/RegA family two-component response regulator